MSTLRERVEGLIASWRKKADAIDDGSGVTLCAEIAQHYRNRAGELEGALAAALVAERQGDALDLSALPYKLTVDLSNYLENHRDCLPKTIALRRDIEFIVKVTMKEVSGRAAAPSLHKEEVSSASTNSFRVGRHAGAEIHLAAAVFCPECRMLVEVGTDDCPHAVALYKEGRNMNYLADLRHDLQDEEFAVAYLSACAKEGNDTLRIGIQEVLAALHKEGAG